MLVTLPRIAGHRIIVNSVSDPTTLCSIPTTKRGITVTSKLLQLSTLLTQQSHHVSIRSNILLMNYQVMVESPAGIVKARTLLDTGSSASFVSERLAHSLRLHRYCQNARICGIAGLREAISCSIHHIIPSHPDSVNTTSHWRLASMYYLPSTTLEALARPFTRRPRYAKTGRIDILLGVMPVSA